VVGGVERRRSVAVRVVDAELLGVRLFY
jgi:hypothetical protein